MRVSGTISYDFGTSQAFLIGLESASDMVPYPPPVKLGGPMDFYSADVANREFHLLDFWPEPGRYKLRLECVGKNPMSRGYFLGIESVRLRERRPRVEKWGWDKDQDWRKYLKLYG